MVDPYEKWQKELRESDRDPKTKAKYRQILTAFRTWLGSRHPDVPLAKEFISDLREMGYAQRTLLAYRHGLSPFFDSMGKSLKIKLKKPYTIPSYWSVGDMERLVAQAEKGLQGHAEWQCRRNTAMLLVLFYTGIRRSELQGLTVSNIDFERGVVVVRQGKGRKDRSIPMAERIVIPLRGLCKGKGPQAKVFERVAGRGVHKAVTALARSVGLDGFSPHSCRHWFGTQLIERGANLREVQELMGHQSIETTAVYLDVVAHHLRHAISLLDRPLSSDSEREGNTKFDNGRLRAAE